MKHLLFGVSTWVAAFAAATAADPLQLVHTIPLPGVHGRFDHFASDPANHRLTVAALGNQTAEIFDTNALERTNTITGLHKPTGTLLLSEPARAYVANGDDGSLRAFETGHFAPVGQLDSLPDADNMRFDPATKRIYVGYGEGALGVTDPTVGKLLQSIALPAHPESFQLESHSSRIFVNVPAAKEITVVDRSKGTTLAHWPMGQWLANFPMALDEAGHRLFVGCRKPARLVVFDTESGKAVADLQIAGDTDDLFFDAKRQRLYVSCGEGYLDVVQHTRADQYERIAHLPTRGLARTCFFSPEGDRLFLAVPERAGQVAELRVYQPQ